VDTIVNYIKTLIPRGLKAVIFTGGGEPTIHPQWNKIVSRLRLLSLKFGLITNGIDLEYRNLEIFDWIRISVNYPVFDRLMQQRLPIFSLKANCTIGLSLIYTGLNKQFSISQLLYMAQRYKAKYIRVLPDCVPEQLSKAHLEIDKWLNDHPNYDTSIFLHQHKYHGTPITDYCPQAYFRPYLSEIDGGTIFPCDSVVLNNPSGKFENKYAICMVDEIGDFLDGKIKQQFNPNEDCKGCVFHENINMLHDWTKGVHQFHKHTREIKHEDFV
jgi:organic radical activating enzyme